MSISAIVSVDDCLSIWGLIGDTPNGRPFRIPPFESAFASRCKSLSPPTHTRSSTSPFSFVATTSRSDEACYYVWRNLVQLKITGPEVGGSSTSDSLRVEVDSCAHRNVGHESSLSTVPNATSLITAEAPMREVSVVLSAEHGEPSRKKCVALTVRQSISFRKMPRS